MAVSSRTPEGTPNRCPICASEVHVEPSRPLGDAPCPSCGTLLWFFQDSTETHFFASGEAGAIRELLRTITTADQEQSESATQQLQSLLKKLGADSLDVVELVMEFEEQGT
jgi:hypothetical protein